MRTTPCGDAFSLPDYYPVVNEWRVQARFDRYPDPRVLKLDDVTQGTVENESPGELVFSADGREHRLVAFASASSNNFFVSLWDSTALVNTYQGGRYLRVPFADSTGWTTTRLQPDLQSPRACSPRSPCAASTPPENRLQLAVTAGEQRPENPMY